MLRRFLVRAGWRRSSRLGTCLPGKGEVSSFTCGGEDWWERRKGTFIYFISFLLVNSPMIGAVVVSMNFSITSSLASPDRTSCSPSLGRMQTMLGTVRPADLTSLELVAIPKLYWLWYLDARDVYVLRRWWSSGEM